MATRRRVKCINKTDRTSAHERIKNIGGDNWKEKEDDAIEQIEAKTHSYYTYEDGKEAEVIVAKHDGHKYLKTENDGEQPDNLLKLPECPNT